jgi:hypothetical protein
MGNEPGADGLVRSRPIVDNDLLAEALRHYRLDQTRHDVDAAARWRSNDQLDDAGRRFLATREPMCVHQQRGRQQCCRYDTLHSDSASLSTLDRSAVMPLTKFARHYNNLQMLLHVYFHPQARIITDFPTID